MKTHEKPKMIDFLPSAGREWRDTVEVEQQRAEREQRRKEWRAIAVIVTLAVVYTLAVIIAIALVVKH